MNKYLVINGGSSSLKFSLYEIENGKEKEIVNGLVERIGMEGSGCVLKYNGERNRQRIPIANHIDAVKVMLNKLVENKFIENIEEIKGVGHRVLHGGEFYNDSVIITPEVLNIINSLEPFGPLHIPGEVIGIKSMMSVLPNVPQIAVFDTAFHQTMPKENYLYAIPYEYYTNNGIRKYGFHGTSHKYIVERIQEKLQKENVNIISCHLGNGASICAIENGKSINTSMGFTPIDGLIMGTRSGSIDPSIVEHMCLLKNINVEECLEILNKESGLLGISGISSDIRDLQKYQNEGNKQADLTLKMFEKAITKYIAEYYVELKGKVDAIVFTAGIGENCIGIRENIVNNLSEALNIELNSEANNKIATIKEGIITSANSKIPVYVIPTNEEYMILKDTMRLSKEYYDNLEAKKLSKGK